MIRGGGLVERSGSGPVQSSSLGTVIPPGTTTSPASVQYNDAGQIIAVYETWNVGVTYRNNDLAVAGPGDSQVYKSVQAGNLGNDPTIDDGTNWLAVSIPIIGTANGQVPIWDDSAKQFVPGVVGGGGGGMPTGIAGQFPVNDGVTPWVAVTMSGDATMDDMGAVTVESSNGNVFPVAPTVKGDLMYANGAATFAFLHGNTSATKKFLVQTGTGIASAAPVWQDGPTALGWDFVDNETPAGTIDGANGTFVCGAPPIGSSLQLFSDDAFLVGGVDYTLTVDTIVIADADHVPTTSLVAFYRKAV